MITKSLKYYTKNYFVVITYINIIKKNKKIGNDQNNICIDLKQTTYKMKYKTKIELFNYKHNSNKHSWTYIYIRWTIYIYIK